MGRCGHLAQYSLRVWHCGPVLRLKGVETLRSLTVCSAAAMTPGEFAGLGELGPDLEELVVGGMHEAWPCTRYLTVYS